MDRDELMVTIVEQEYVIWKRNHPHFKNTAMKEQAWARVALQLGISPTEAERRFKSIREKYRRRKILLERDMSMNVQHSKIRRWDLFNKLSFLDDFMIPRNGNESLGMINTTKSEMVSSEYITSTNEVSILPIPNNKLFTSTPNGHHQQSQQFLEQHQYIGNVIIEPVRKQNGNNGNNHIIQQSLSRSSQSTPSPSTTMANDINDKVLEANSGVKDAHFDPIVKMEVPDVDDSDSNVCMEPKICENGNFNYVGEFIAAELNKLPLRDAFMLKNILIREVLTFSERIVMEREKQ